MHNTIYLLFYGLFFAILPLSLTLHRLLLAGSPTAILVFRDYRNNLRKINKHSQNINIVKIYKLHEFRIQ